MDDRSFVAAQDFLLSSKTFWTKQIYEDLKRTYEDAVARSGETPTTPADVAAILVDLGLKPPTDGTDQGFLFGF